MNPLDTGGRPGRARSRPVRLATAAIMAAALAATAACSDDGGETGEDGRIEIRFSWWGNDERAADTERMIQIFEEQHPDIDVIGESSDFNAYFDKLATEVAAGRPPDVITMGGAYPGEYGSRGALLDLSTVSDVLRTDNIEESALGNGVFDGVQYGIPTGVNTYALVVNPNLFEAAGVELPDDDNWTWDDFVAIANQLARNLPDDHYALPDPTAAETLELFSLQRGEGLYTPEGGVAISEQSFIDWWTMTLGLRDSGATPDAALTAELEGQPGPEQTLMGRGLAAMQFDWSNQLPALRSASGEPLRLIRVPGESSGVQPAMWLQASQLYTISSASEHPREAAMLVDFLVNSPEAGRIVLTDRGVPANSEVLDAILPELDEGQSATAEFIARVLPTAGRPLVIGPVGSTETPLIIDRYNAEVLFDRMTPAEAASQALSEIRAAIGQ